MVSAASGTGTRHASAISVHLNPCDSCPRKQAREEEIGA